MTLGWQPGPSDVADERRWQAAMPQMAMALAEVGHPAAYAESRPEYRHVLRFDAPYPDDQVLVKAGELCGVEDLVLHLLNDGCRCHLCRLVEDIEEGDQHHAD